MEIRLLHNLARSGGTLISRCIGSMNGIVQLSEIHPLGVDVFNPLTQAHNWYNLLTPQDLSSLKNNKMEFAEAITLIASRCEKRGVKLVIRDWSHLDFVGIPYNAYPSYRLTLSDVLKHKFQIIQTATVRHPFDVWLSLRRLRILKEKISLESFLRGYLRFAECSVNIGYAKYEDFVADPDSSLKLLCQRLNLPFDPGYIDRWSTFSKITGDPITQNRGSNTIRPIPRRSYEPYLIEQFAANSDYQKAIELLGYEHPV